MEGSFKNNIFHLAVYYGRTEFVRGALERLPAELNLELLSQPSQYGWNPLHLAARWRYLEIIRLILGFCVSFPEPPHRPWLALCNAKSTPLHCALYTYPGLKTDTEESAMEILEMNYMESLITCVNNAGDSPLFLAVKKGFNKVAEKILMSSFKYSVSGQTRSTPLHFAPYSSDCVLKLLLASHLDMFDAVDDKGYTMLHQWAKIGQVWPLESLLKDEEFPDASAKVFRDLITYTTEKDEGNNPLHIAARSVSSDFGLTLVRGYLQHMRAAVISESLDCPPWKTLNKDGNTPLHLAISSKNEELALQFLLIDSTLCQIHNNKGESPLFIAVSSGCGQVVEELLKIIQDVRFSMLRRTDGVTLLHSLSSCPENIGRRLLGKFWWMMNLRDDKGRTALDIAKEANIPWLVSLLMKPSLIQKETFDWITACEKPDETPAVHAFIDTCHDLQAVCREQNDTPLHHIKLQTYGDYKKFLKIPSIAELKNATDSEGATPLHRALQKEDMLLATLLLIDDGVERNKEDGRGFTAMDLLAELCKKKVDWAKMCKQIKINPYLRTSYIKPGSNLDQMRNTLSVVAALLATITFAAGFTLPGGLNDETGDAILAKKAAFLVFLLSDVYAMCTSMLVLFCLIWSMVSTRDMSYLLVDRSVLILMQALYGTMVAFMTGIYAVIAHSSLWAAIIIFIMCSFIGISSNRTVLHNVLARFIPAADQEKGDRIRLLEEGKAFNSGDDDSRKVE